MIVIGAGIVGSSVAFHLARAGVSVEVIEQNRPAGGATATTFARLSAFGEEPAAYFRLVSAGMREYARLATALPGERWYHPCGSLICDSDEARLARQMAKFESLGYRLRWSESAQIAPELLPRSVSRMLHAPDEGWVDASALTVRLLAEAQRRGALVTQGEVVTGLARASGAGWWVLVDSGRELSCDVVVNAAGAAAGLVGALAGARLDLVPDRGLLATLAIGGRDLAQVVHTDEVSIRPAGPGQVMVRSDQVDRRLADEPKTAQETLCQDLVCRALATVPALDGSTVIDSRVGARVIPASGYASVGGVGDVPGYYQAVAQDGVVLGPLLGRLLTAEITEGNVHALLAPYRPRSVAKDQAAAR